MSVIELVWVVDDVAAPPARAEHGFAVWVRTPHGQLLYDTGGSGDVLRHNLNLLGLDPVSLDALVISHAHDDHTGGLEALLPLLRPGTPLYAHPTLFRQRYSSKSGPPEVRGVRLAREAMAERLDLRLEESPQEVLPGVWTTGAITARPAPEGRSAHHLILEEGAYRPDPYADDLSLILETGRELFLLCGCCHAGLLNTLDHVQHRWDGPVVGIGGGTHMHKAANDLLRQSVERVAALPGLKCVWLGHCSGDAFLLAMEDALGAKARRGMGGARLTLQAVQEGAE